MVAKPYRRAVRIVFLAAQSWRFLDGYAADRGFDPFELGTPRFFNWVYYLHTRNLDEVERERFEMELDAPFPGDNPAKVSEEEAELEGAGFLALYTQVTGGRVQDLNTQ